MNNLNLIFNKLYYKDINQSDFKKINNEIFNTKFDENNDYCDAGQLRDITGFKSFKLKTDYPGLLVGIGNPHGFLLNAKDDIKNGFSFDYVTGQPYIPGSSVKGILRNIFIFCEEFVRDKVSGVLDKETFSVFDLRDLEKEIFDDNDVFFDAVIFKGDKSGKIVGEDFITPHKDELKEPIPLKIIRIVPDVVFEFRFILHDGLLSADQKSDLFKSLLICFGAGAKTNTGYGILKE